METIFETLPQLLDVSSNTHAAGSIMPDGFNTKLFHAAYYSGMGKIAGGPRTMCYVAAVLANTVLAGAVLYKLALG